jgi:hypothetical protein
VEEFLIGDDDVCGAYRHHKYHRNAVLLHLARVRGLDLAMTGTTFRDVTSPGCYYVIEPAREQLAMSLWEEPNIVEQTAPYIPALSFPPPVANSVLLHLFRLMLMI